jgi:deoxyribonuclease-4
MRLGGHFPISKSLCHAIDLLEEAGGKTIQIFTKNPGQWKARNISENEAKSFISYSRSKDVSPLIVHDSYLINLASPDDTLRNKSLEAFIDEIFRADKIGADYLVTHMGTHNNSGEEAGMLKLSKSIKKSIESTRDVGVSILLETTAGQGTQLGYRFEHIAYVLDQCNRNPRLGVCLDTCHVFAAGYDISNNRGYQKTIEEFEKVIGWDNLKVIHVNDSKRPLNSRVDRHAHIGEGYIGIDFFANLMNDPRFDDIPLIVETPDPETMHKIQIETLKKLIKV